MKLVLVLLVCAFAAGCSDLGSMTGPAKVEPIVTTGSPAAASNVWSGSEESAPATIVWGN